MCFSRYITKVKGKVCDIFQYSFTATALTFVPSPRVVVSVFEVEPYETRNGFAYMTSMVAHSVKSLVREGNHPTCSTLPSWHVVDTQHLQCMLDKSKAWPWSLLVPVLGDAKPLVPFLVGWSAANSFCPFSCE
jgi:hypothetical protein